MQQRDMCKVVNNDYQSGVTRGWQTRRVGVAQVMTGQSVAQPKAVSRANGFGKLVSMRRHWTSRRCPSPRQELARLKEVALPPSCPSAAPVSALGNTRLGRLG